MLVQPSRADNLPLCDPRGDGDAASGRGRPASAGSRSSSSTARPGCVVEPERTRRAGAAPRASSPGSPERRLEAADAAARKRAAEHFSADGVARRIGRALRGAVRILHVIQELGTGGAEQVLLSTYRGARRRVTMMSSSPRAPGPLAAQLEASPLPVPLVQRRPWRIPAAANAVRRAVRQTRPDVVHVHNPAMAPRDRSRHASAGRRPPGTRERRRPEEDWPEPCACCALAGLPRRGVRPRRGCRARAAWACRSPRRSSNAVGPAPARGRFELEHEPGTASCSRSGGWRSRRTTRLRSSRCGRCRTRQPAIAGEGRFAPSSSGSPQRQRVAVIGSRSGQTRRRADGRRRRSRDAARAGSRPAALALEALASGTPLVATERARRLREPRRRRSGRLARSGRSDALAAALRAVLDDPNWQGGFGDADARSRAPARHRRGSWRSIPSCNERLAA